MRINEIFKDIYKGLRIEYDNKLEPFEAYTVDTSVVDNCVINYSKNGLEEIHMNVKDKFFLKPNDIVIATIPSSSTAHVGYCSSIDDKAIIKKNLIILRNPYDDRKYNLEFIAEYLEIYGIKDYFDNVKKNREGLTIEDIKDIEIPNIERGKQDELMNAIHPINERSRLYNKLIQNDNEIKNYLMNEVIYDEE